LGKVKTASTVAIAGPYIVLSDNSNSQATSAGVIVYLYQYSGKFQLSGSSPADFTPVFNPSPNTWYEIEVTITSWANKRFDVKARVEGAATWTYTLTNANFRGAGSLTRVTKVHFAHSDAATSSEYKEWACVL